MARYYSDITNKLYDSMSDLEKEEKKAKEQRKADERKARAQEVDELQKEYVKARKDYTDALKKFCKDYGTYHTSISTENLFDFLLNW